MSKVAARKMILSYLVVENKNLSNNNKIELLKFIRDKITQEQLKSIVTESRVVSLGEKRIKKIDQLLLEDEQSGKLQAAWGATKRVVGTVAGASPMMTVYLAAFLIGKARDIARNYLSKAARKCNDLALGSMERRHCETRAKLGMINIQIQNLKAGRAQCTKTKNPKECTGKIDEKIKQLESEVREIKALE